MGLKDFYFTMEDKYYKFIDKLDTIFPAHAIVDKIDKIMPSMILFFILFLVIIALIVWAVIPTYANVQVSFFADGMQVTQDLPFSVFVGDENLSFEAKSGIAELKLPKSDLYRIKVNTDKYGIDKEYSLADEIKVILEVKKKILPVEVYFKDGYKNVNSVSVFFDCENIILPDTESSKTTENGYVEVQVPEDCGQLNITANAEGYSLKKESCDSTSCMVYLDPITKVNLEGTTDVPLGTLTVNIKDSVGNSKDGSVTIYSTNDQINPVDIGSSVGGFYKSTALSVGTYKVYVSVEGYLPETQTTTVYESGSSINVIVKKNSLGNITVKLDEKINFSIKLKSKTNEILFSGESEKNVVIMPVFAYGSYLVDVTPKDENYAVIANKEVQLEEGQKELVLDVKEITSFNSKLFHIHVTDEDELPIQGAKIFVQDLFTGFEIFSPAYNKETDKDGNAQIMISQEGVYIFRVYKGYSEGLSEQVQVVETSAGDMPEETTTIILYLGTGGFNLQVLDELDYPVPFAQFDFFNKGFTESIGMKLTDNLGKIMFSLKAGTEKFFKVKKEGYLPFFSESRVLTPQVMWDGNINLEPQKLKGDDEKARVDFLGIFGSMGGEKTSFEIGKEVYLGYDIHLYEDVGKVRFEYTTGKDATNVEQDALFIIRGLSSSQSEAMYEDLEKTILTEDEGKVFDAKWNKGIDSAKVEQGTYRIYIKLKVRNDTSVSLYAPLNIKWKLYLDEKMESSEEKQYFLGSSVDCTDMFCAKTAVVDLENDLYLENLGNVNKNEQKYALVIGKAYGTEFTLMNGITASDGEIENGYLKAHVANDPNQSFLDVESDIDNYNYFQFQKIEVSGPGSEKTENYSAKTVLINEHKFTKFFANKIINGSFFFVPTYDNSSYLNFWVIDSDKKVPVRGKPAFNYTLVPDAPHSLSIKLFPNTVLVPNKPQNLKVYVYDETEAIVKDVQVLILKKSPKDAVYSGIYSCSNLTTDYEGKTICTLPPMEPGTFIQVTAYKEGYKSYKHKDLKPDLKVVEEIISFNPEKLDVEFSYPRDSVVTTDLKITNSSAEDVIIKNASIEFDKYSQDSKYLLNWEAMESYFASEFNGKVIYGIEEKLEPNETTLKNFFKVIAGQNVDNSIYADKIGGIIKMYLDTSPGEIVLEIPFSISFKLDSYPENAGECLKISMDEKDFYLEKAITTPLTIINTCLLDQENLKPAVFNKMFLLLTLEGGSYSIAGYTITIPDKISATVDVGIPALIMENLKTELTSPEKTASLGINPRSTQGYQKIGIKLMGYVNTESGSAKVESNKLEINVNSINIANCIGVYNTDGDKIEKIDFDVFDSTEYLATPDAINNKVHGPSTEIELKNECDGSLLYLRACKNNDFVFSPGCGNENSDAKLSFSVEDFTKGIELKGNESKKIEIFRPAVPGAYSLDLWVKTKDQFGYKKIYDIKTNVKTTTAYGLFSYNPFLPMFDLNKNVTPIQTGDTYESDIMYLFNKDLWITKMSDLETLESIEECEGGSSGCWDSLDKLDLSSGMDNLTENGEVDNSATARKATFWAGTGVAAVGILILVGCALMTAPVGGWIAAGVVAVAAGAIAIIAALAPDDFEQKTNYFMYDLVGEDIAYNATVYSVSNHKTYNWVTGAEQDPVKLASLFGETYYNLYFVEKLVSGSVGFSGGDHKSDLWFTVDCGAEYEPYLDGIVIHDFEKENCSWPDEEPYVVNGSELEFRPDCSSAGFLDEFNFKSHVYVPCKLKSKNWAYEQFKGVDYGLPNAGLARVKFTSTALKSGYNYVESTMNVIGLLDTEPREVRFRVALYNPLQEEEKMLPLGENCMRGNDIVGYTGENAIPKLKYNWSWTDSESPYNSLEFCGRYYCDSTQFMMNMFNRVDSFNEDILNLSNENSMELPKTKPVGETIEPEYDYDITKLKSLGLKSVGVFLGNQNAVFLKVTKEDKDTNISKIEVLYGNKVGTMVTMADNTNVYSYQIDEGGYEEYKELDGKEYSVTLKVYLDDKPGYMNVKISFKYIPPQPEQSISVPLSTEIYDGAMAISKWFWDGNYKLDDATSDVLNKAQKKIFFVANIMKDGFTTDFIQDFANSCADEFFYCPDIVENKFISLMAEGRLTVQNVDGGTKLNGPGKYVVRTYIYYENPDLKLEDANIAIILEKVEPPVQDNILYYMPLDGPIGITNYEVDRQGYGVDFAGATVDLFKMGSLAKKITTNSVSNPINTLNVSSEYSFVKSNVGSGRGRVLGVSMIGESQVSVDFMPLMQNKFEVKIYPEEKIDTKYCYSLSVGNETYQGPSSILPFFATDLEAKDFTGQIMADNYPKESELNVCGDKAGIKYGLETVTSKEPIKLYTYVYTQSGYSPELNDHNPTKTKKTGNILNSIFDEIGQKNLCISATSQTMNIFWNESIGQKE